MKNFKLIALSLTASFIFVGCASVEQISMKDGKPLFQSKCRTSTADCHKLASEKCKSDYNIIDQSTNWPDHYMVFQCK